MIKLNDCYLLNNIKIIGEIDEFKINKVEFQNIKTGSWDKVMLYNPDKNDTIIKEPE